MSSGSVIERKAKDGTVSWLLKYDAARDATGKRQQRYKTVKGTKKAAQAELRRLLSEVDTGMHVDPSALTVAQWVETWLQGLSVLEKVSVRTHEGYADILRRRVVPAIGQTPIQKLTGSQIDSLYAQLLTSGAQQRKATPDRDPKGLSPQSVLHVHRALSQCLKAAARKRLIARNPAEDAEAPKPKRTRNHGTQDCESEAAQALDLADVPKLLDAFEGKPLRTFVALSLATGLRRGEGLALKWSAVDLDKQTVLVNRVLEQTRAHGVRIKADAKNESSRRTIGIDPDLCDLLRVHRNEQRLLALKLGVPYPADCLVFPCVIKRARGQQPLGGPLPKDVDFARPWDPAAVSKEFIRHAKRAGLGGFSLHSLRHTHATQLLLGGVPLHVVAQRLGHSTPVITMTTYAHVLRRAEDQAVGAAGGLLRAALRL